MKKEQIIIQNHKYLDVRNLDAMPRGLNCKYLEVVLSPNKKVYIAYKWHRKLKKTDFGIFIQLGKK